jgi:hypothetical protein
VRIAPSCPSAPVVPSWAYAAPPLPHRPAAGPLPRGLPKIRLQVNGAVTAVDQALGYIEQVQELGGAQAPKLDVVDLSLDRRELREQSITLVRDFQPYASPVAWVRKLADETTLEQIVGDRRHEGCSETDVRPRC